MHLDEIFYGGDDIKYDLDSILLNPIASNISKWQTFKFLMWCYFGTLGGVG
jgi:hypothetical protein